jgi:hypothetical protein
LEATRSFRVFDGDEVKGNGGGSGEAVVFNAEARSFGGNAEF